MKERGDCEGGRAPNIDQGASVAMRQRGACAKVERKARTRRDFLAFFAPCAIADWKFTLSDGFGSLASALEHAALVSLDIHARTRARLSGGFRFLPSLLHPHVVTLTLTTR